MEWVAGVHTEDKHGRTRPRLQALAGRGTSSRPVLAWGPAVPPRKRPQANQPGHPHRLTALSRV